ncbi:hypothetical protein ACFOWZ_31615 [Lentzea rhizosphaerae]|uniref:Uncharacterized protein n=1 Tax=Lentzea rhizosphaerae TaxID=2041025 RepID=A0ABV8C233_9PSEU
MVVVVPHAEALPSLRQFVRDACEDVVNRMHSFDGDIAALGPLFEDEETSARFKAPYLHVW